MASLSYTMRPLRPKQPLTKKEKAKNIYKQLIEDEELMHELNVLLRKQKIKKIKKDEQRR